MIIRPCYLISGNATASALGRNLTRNKSIGRCQLSVNIVIAENHRQLGSGEFVQIFQTFRVIWQNQTYSSRHIGEQHERYTINEIDIGIPFTQLISCQRRLRRFGRLA